MVSCFCQFDGFPVLFRNNIFPGRGTDFRKLIAHDPVYNPIQFFYSIA